jgi:glycosyltransferase involved in cell wall biosynthesis
MRIAIIYETTFPEFKGGVERWFSQLASGLAGNSIQVIYLNGNGRNENAINLEYRPLERIRESFHETGARSAQNAISYTLATLYSLKKIDAEVLYLSSYPFLHIWAARIFRITSKRKYRIYVEWFELPTLNYWKRKYGFLFGTFGFTIQQLTLRLGDVNVSHLDSTKDFLQKRQTRKQKIIKLPGVCTFENTAKLTKKNMGKKDICQIGRLTQDKQPLLSLEAIKKLKEKGWRGHFHLLGSGPLEQSVLSYIRNNRMSEYVTAYGDGSDELRTEILEKSATLLHPSIREGFGLAIVEAAQFGVPSILIKGEDNKSIELGINPTLVSEKSDAAEIAGLLQNSLDKHKEYSKECERWIRHKGSKMLAIDSIMQLTRHFQSLVASRK